MTDTAADDRWHLTPTRSERGFAYLPPIPSEYGGHISVSESSAADGPHVWVRATAPVDLNNPHGDTSEAPMHLTADNTLRLADQLRHTVANHYQGDGPPVERPRRHLDAVKAERDKALADLADLRERFAALAAVEGFIGESCENASHNIRGVLAGDDPRADCQEWGLEYR